MVSLVYVHQLWLGLPYWGRVAALLSLYVGTLALIILPYTSSMKFLLGLPAKTLSTPETGLPMPSFRRSFIALCILGLAIAFSSAVSAGTIQQVKDLYFWIVTWAVYCYFVESQLRLHDLMRKMEPKDTAVPKKKAAPG